MPFESQELAECLFFEETYNRILEKRVETKDGPKSLGYDTATDAQITIIGRNRQMMKNYYNTLIRPLLNIAKATRDGGWVNDVVSQYDCDVETGKQNNLGYIHHCFKSIRQYKDNEENKNIIPCLRSINALVSDLRSPYVIESEKLPFPIQGANLPLPIIDNYNKIIFTTPPYLKLLEDWQLGVTFINIAREYSTWPAYWSLLAHEVCGHEIINGYYSNSLKYNPVLYEIIEKINDKYAEKTDDNYTPKKSVNSSIPKDIEINRSQVSVDFESFASQYWTNQAILNETLASVMAYLAIGPSHGIALYSILRPLMMYKWKRNSLLEIPEKSDRLNPLPYGVHPIGVLHMVIAKECMEVLRTGESGKIFDPWINIFDYLSQLDKGDNLFILSEKSLRAKYVIPRDSMVNSVKEIVKIIADSKFKSLNERNICQFYCWDSKDEETVRELVVKLQEGSLEDSTYSKVSNDSGIEPRHVVAASTIASAAIKRGEKNVQKINELNQNALTTLLKMDQKHAEPTEQEIIIQPIVSLNLEHPQYLYDELSQELQIPFEQIATRRAPSLISLRSF